MSWSCPHEVDKRCKRLKKPCKPGIKGCVLTGKVKFIDFKEDNLKKEG